MASWAANLDLYWFYVFFSLIVHYLLDLLTLLCYFSTLPTSTSIVLSIHQSCYASFLQLANLIMYCFVLIAYFSITFTIANGGLGVGKLKTKRLDGWSEPARLTSYGRNKWNGKDKHIIMKYFYKLRPQSSIVRPPLLVSRSFIPPSIHSIIPSLPPQISPLTRESFGSRFFYSSTLDSIHSTMHLFIYLVSHPCIHSINHSFVYSSMHPRMHASMESFIHAFNHSINVSINPCIYAFIHSFSSLSIRYFIHAFILSVHPCMNSLIY